MHEALLTDLRAELFVVVRDEHIARGLDEATATVAARYRLEEYLLFKPSLHPRDRRGEFSGSGHLSREVRTRSGVKVRTRPFMTDREKHLHSLYESKPMKFGRKQGLMLKHIKNVLTDPGTPKGIKLQLAGGALGLIAGTVIPIIPGDEVIAGAVIHNALEKAAGRTPQSPGTVITKNAGHIASMPGTIPRIHPSNLLPPPAGRGNGPDHSRKFGTGDAEFKRTLRK